MNNNRKYLSAKEYGLIVVLISLAILVGASALYKAWKDFSTPNPPATEQVE